MATPQLKTTGAAPAPRRLLNTGAAPKKQVKLMGSNGQAIQPKKPALKTPAADTAPQPTAVAPTPAPAPAPEEDMQAKAAAEAAAAEEAARIAAEEEAARLAQEEYERQMEEYNRQMEEYNRQMEEYNRQQAAAAAAEATVEPIEEAPAPAVEETPAPAPAATPKAKPANKLNVAKPALKAAASNKPATAKPKAAAKPAPAATPSEAPEGEIPEEGPTAEDEAKAQALYELAQAQQKRGLFGISWLTMPVACGIIGLAALGVICGSLIIKANAEAAAKQAHMDYTNKLLKRAQDINKQGIESIADAKTKGVTIVCSKEDAQYLLDVVVDPFVRDEKGKYVFGGNPEGVAQLACLLLGLASEQDPGIDALIFRTLDTKCTKIKPTLYRWLVQRMAVSNNKGINVKFKKLADSVAKQQWMQRAEVLSYIWEAMGLRVTKKDIPTILGLLKDPDIDKKLAGTLAGCLDNILIFMDDEEEKKQVGDEIFDKLPEQYRDAMLNTFGRACSPKALAYYKERAADKKNWRNDHVFFANYANDDIIPYLQELKEQAGDDEKNAKYIDRAIGGVFAQDRDRTDEEAEALIKVVFDKIDGDISKRPELVAKTDEYSADYVGEGPELDKLKEELKDLDETYNQRVRLINTLKGMHDRPWVLKVLSKYEKDDDPEIANAAADAKAQVKENTAADAHMRKKYQTRGQE
ncbi:MAG: hypothetical protein IJ985_08795 [Akkermansia sp.]|nr:hypothetical protein [Akkermansia sp.]